MRCCLYSCLAVIGVLVAAPAYAQPPQAPWKAENLQYFPKDISRERLTQRMREFSFALGVRCQYCHAGGNGISFEGVSFASDEKPAKVKARAMLRMVDQLNATLLPQLPSRAEPRVEVDCATCAELVHDDPDKADYMIAGLSGLLRRTLDLGAAQEISLGAELDLLSLYLDIQKARFGDRLQVRVHVGDEARGASVPVFLLQPLVENAIRHGLAARLNAGRIDVDARRVGARLAIRVEDDGRGVGVRVGPNEERVGLGNTRARLETLYGDDQTLELTPAAAGGACVRIDIPFRSTGVPA